MNKMEDKLMGVYYENITKVDDETGVVSHVVRVCGETAQRDGPRDREMEGQRDIETETQTAALIPAPVP